MEIICNECGDVDNYRTEKKGNNLVAYCQKCGAYIKNLPYSEPALYFGMYKGTKIKDFTTPKMLNYLHWAYNNVKLTHNIRQAIKKQLGIREEDEV